MLNRFVCQTRNPCYGPITTLQTRRMLTASSRSDSLAVGDLAVGDALLQSEYRYLGGCEVGWPQNFRETFCNGDLLCSIDRISNDASTDRATEVLAPQFASVC